jgi:tetraacyldisaccharide 4'-kinase
VASGEKKGIVASVALAVFTLLSLAYLLLHLLRALAYKLHLRRVRRLPKKVVSVGNLTMGGTGKTPFVEMLSRMRRERNRKPVILSRGYGSKDGTPSDEFLILRENLPKVGHYANPNRYQAGMEALAKENPDIFLLDDGFQHWQLGRDLDIVLVDALNPFGYGRLTPRGMLREPLGALRRAGMFVITRSDQVQPQIIDALRQSLAKFNPGAPVLVSHHEARSLRNAHTQKKRDIEFLKGRKVLGFCGIGNPRAFHGLLVHLGAQVAAFHVFRDHFRYSPEIVELMSKEAKLLGCEALVTTQKDGVKLRDFKTEPPLLELLIAVKITEGCQQLESRLAGLLEGE